MPTLSARQIAAGQRRSLRAMVSKLLDMAAQWGEIDTYCMGSLEDAAKELERIAASLIADEES